MSGPQELTPEEVLADAANGRISILDPYGHLSADEAEQRRAQRRAAHDLYLRDQTAWVTRDGRRLTTIEEIYDVLGPGGGQPSGSEGGSPTSASEAGVSTQQSHDNLDETI